MISISSIEPSAMNARKVVDQESINELAQSIKENGLLQPIILRKHDKKKGVYEIVCGERRWRACDIAGLKDIPAIVKDLDYKQAYNAMITENLQRKDIEPLEEAEAFNLLSQSGQSIAEMSCKFGKSERYIKLRLLLNNLIAPFKDRLSKKDISLGVALEICKIEEDKQQEVFDYYQGNAMSIKGVIDIIERKFSYELKNAAFGLDEKIDGYPVCNLCSNNSSCSLSLFENSREDAKCMDKICYKQKTKDAIIKKAVAGNAGMILTVEREDIEEVKDVIKSLKSLGIDVISWSDRYSYMRAFKPECPMVEDYEDVKEYDEDCVEFEKKMKVFYKKVNAGEIEKVISIGDYAGLCWKEQYALINAQVKTEGCLEGTKSKEDIELKSLQEQDDRNMKIRDENVIGELRQNLNKKDYDLNTEALSLQEEIVMIAMMMREGTTSMREKLGVNSREFHDKDMVELCKNMTTEQRNVIIRGFIKQKVTDGSATYNKATQEGLKLIMIDQFPEETKEVNDKFDLVYNRRKERIEKRIEEIKA